MGEEVTVTFTFFPVIKHSYFLYWLKISSIS